MKHLWMLVGIVWIVALPASGQNPEIPPPKVTHNVAEAAAEAHARHIELEAAGCGPGKPITFRGGVIIVARPAAGLPLSAMVEVPIEEEAARADALVRVRIIALKVGYTNTTATVSIVEVLHAGPHPQWTSGTPAAAIRRAATLAPGATVELPVLGGVGQNGRGDCVETDAPGVRLILGGEYVVLLSRDPFPASRGGSRDGWRADRPWDWLRVGADGSLLSLYKRRDNGQEETSSLSSLEAHLHGGAGQ